MNQEAGAGFIYLDVNGLLLVTRTTPNVLQLAFPTDIVLDMEVVSPELLQKQLTEFFGANTIGPTRFVLALSQNLLFEQPFTKAPDKSTQQAIEQFLESVPFEHPGTIIFENAESKIIAANKDFYQAFVEALSSLQSTVVLVTPAVVLGIDVNQALALGPGSVDDIFKRSQSLKQYGFALDGRFFEAQLPTEQGKKKSEKQPDKKKHPNTRALLLLGVLGVLLVMLVVVFFFNPFA